MKRLLIILFFGILITSCADTEYGITDSTTIEQSVIEDLKISNADTLYVLETESYHYYFDSNKSLIKKYNVDSDYIIIPAGLLIFLLMVVFSISSIIGAAIKVN